MKKAISLRAGSNTKRWWANKQGLGAGLLLTLAACTNPALENPELAHAESSAGVSATALISNVAWGERVELAVPSSYAVTVKYGGTSLKIASRSSGKVVFDLPASPPLTAFSTAATVDATAFATAPTALEAATYADRGTVLVQVYRNSNNALVASQDYKPFGSVESGELTIFGPPVGASCASIPAGYSNVEGPLIFDVGGQTWCLRTVRFSTRGTQSALSNYAAARPTQSIDRNALSTLDPSGLGSFDPSCGQIEKWLNPFTSQNFGNMLMFGYQAATNANLRGLQSGAGINVHLLGGGLDANDKLSCAPNVNFKQHDTHVRDLIKAIAPNVTVLEKKVCFDNGSCPASWVAKGLLEVAQAAALTPLVQADLVNLSLGAPLSNSAVYGALKALNNHALVVASGGNHPFADSHFPASYASDLGQIATQNELSNVIAVAATGYDSSALAWKIGGFNTRQNANLFAPGINLCPASALSFRCSPTNTTNYADKGISGSSFSTAAVVGVAALYQQQAGATKTPAQLKSCLTDKATLNPSLSKMVWYDPTGCP